MLGNDDDWVYEFMWTCWLQGYDCQRQRYETKQGSGVCSVYRKRGGSESNSGDEQYPG